MFIQRRVRFTSKRNYFCLSLKIKKKKHDQKKAIYLNDQGNLLNKVILARFMYSNHDRRRI